MNKEKYVEKAMFIFIGMIIGFAVATLYYYYTTTCLS